MAQINYNYLDYSITRTRRFLVEIDTIKESEFPYNHSKEALYALKTQFSKILSDLERAKKTRNDLTIIKKICAEALHDIKLHLPLLGFILRSTNVRNAFEVYGPLLRLSRDVLEPDTPLREKLTKLILSSEWQYSPFTYTEIPNLKGFVFIGSPAHEASNPLLIPLAGHELGHSIWLRDKLSNQYLPKFESNITSAVLENWDRYIELFFEQDAPHKTVTKETFNIGDLIVLPTISKASAWLAKQAEETFCDCVGIKLFGESFLKAFAYLIAPSYASKRSPSYPNLLIRAKNQILAAKEYKVDIPLNYVELFSNFPESKMVHDDDFQLKIAEQCLQLLTPNIIDTAGKLLDHQNIPIPSTIERDNIDLRFRQLVPPQEIKSLADIINAGWKMYEDIGEANSDGLKELILKTIEIFEIEQILFEQRFLEEDVKIEQVLPSQEQEINENQPSLFE